MRRALTIIAIILLLTILFCNNCKGNTIKVLPTYQFNQENTQINIQITCTPTEPIKAYEFKIEFNPDLLEANNVSEGDFFEGYMTFFNAGIINNTAGNIINIYNLIVGQGNITTTGTLVNITFVSKNQTGVSPIHIYGYGITNETQYLPININDGALQIYGQYYPWDINEDNRINFRDISSMVAHYRETCIPGSQPWDIIEDGVANYLDISILVYHYRETYG